MTEAISVDLSAVPPRITGAGRYGVEFIAAAQLCAGNYEFAITALVASGDSSRIKSLTGAATRELIPRNRVARLAYEKAFLGRVLRKEGFALHHGIHYTMPRGFDGKVVVTVHDTTLIEHPEWHERSKAAFFSREISHAAKYADGIIFPSQFVEDRFRTLFGQNQLFQVIPHGVRTFTPPDSFDITSVIGANAVEAGYLLYCGTIEPRKNLERIMEAYLRSGSELFLILVGLKGWNMDSFMDRFASMGSNSKVKALGFVDDITLAALYQNAKCTLYPSLEEGFGLPGLEALAYGSPLITSRDSAMAEYAVDGVVLVDPMSVREITDAILKVTEHGELQANYKVLGVEQSLRYSWERSGIAHLDFYKRVLEG